jgi:hypothetical protein
MNFEILCLDSAEQVKSRTVKTLLYALMANDNLFETPTMNLEKHEIKDEKKKLELRVTQFSTDKMLTGVRYSVAFTIAVKCNEIKILDGFRMALVDYVKALGFSNVRILLDEVSAQLAVSLYPRLYSLENQVRTFIINFFLKNLGTNWARLALSGDTLEKIKKRKGNDKIFVASNRIDSDVSLIDFDELGRILYSENSILSSKKADNVAILIEKISIATNLNTLKSEVLEGNFYKYFKDCFTQKDFQTKWFDLYYYRNKVAHNSSFSQEEVDTCIALCDSISAIIDTAYEKLDTFKLSTSDQEALMIAVNEFASEPLQDNPSNSSPYSAVNEETLLKELRTAQETLPFVGLKHFVVEWLGRKGYDYDASFTLVNYLEDKGIIKLKKISSPGADYPTTAISIA